MKGTLLEMETECHVSCQENQSLTNLGAISQLEDTFHGVDSDDDRFWAELGPGHVDPQLVNMATHECKGQF